MRQDWRASAVTRPEHARSPQQQQQTTNNKQQTTNNKQQTANNKQTTNNKQQTTNNKQHTTHNTQQTTNNKQQTTTTTGQTCRHVIPKLFHFHSNISKNYLGLPWFSIDFPSRAPGRRRTDASLRISRGGSARRRPGAGAGELLGRWSGVAKMAGRNWGCWVLMVGCWALGYKIL